jgi:hypothetical protein
VNPNRMSRHLRKPRPTGVSTGRLHRTGATDTVPVPTEALIAVGHKIDALNKRLDKVEAALNGIRDELSRLRPTPPSGS